MNLSESIRMTRRKALMNQEEFAAELNVSLASVNRWEVGKSIPNIAAMKAIKAFCNRKGFPYELIETEWLNSRMVVKK